MIDVATAISKLRPNAQFVMIDQDIDNIIWHTEGVEPLTTAEVQAEVARLEQVVADKEAAEQAARDASIAHAKSLGFTDDMIAVMYPGLSA